MGYTVLFNRPVFERFESGQWQPVEKQSFAAVAVAIDGSVRHNLRHTSVRVCGRACVLYILGYGRNKHGDGLRIGSRHWAGVRGAKSINNGAKSINRPGPSGNTKNWNLEIGPKTRGFGGFFREEEGGELDSSGAEVCEGESRTRKACRIAAYRWVQGTQPPAFHLSGLGDLLWGSV